MGILQFLLQKAWNIQMLYEVEKSTATAQSYSKQAVFDYYLHYGPNIQMRSIPESKLRKNQYGHLVDLPSA